MERFDYLDLSTCFSQPVPVSRGMDVGRNERNVRGPRNVGLSQPHQNRRQEEVINPVPEPANPCSEVSVNDLIKLMIEQNKERDELLRLVLNNSQHDLKSYQIMPDLAQTIPKFDGVGSSAQASEWLRTVESVSKLHNWMESFMIESARTHLIGAAHHWFAARQNSFHTWKDFESAFVKTFIGKISKPELWKRMQTRIQQKGEASSTYFHEKVRFCQDLGLDFEDTKRQLLVGLWSRQLCSMLTSKTHLDLDDLFSDLRTFEEMEVEREELSEQLRPKTNLRQLPVKNVSFPVTRLESNVSVLPNDKTTSNYNNSSVTSPSGKSNKSRYRQPLWNAAGESLCYNCSDYGHIGRDCPKPQRVRFCVRCNTEGHTQKHCIMSKPTGARESATSPGDRQMQVESAEGVGPLKYLKTVTINGSYELQGMIDSGSACCTMRATSAIKCNASIDSTVSILYGFGNTEKAIVKPIGKFLADVSIDGVTGEQITILVVPDSAQPVELLIGRSWTELPHIAFAKIDDQLVLGNRNDQPFRDLQVPSPNGRTKITLESDVTLLSNSVHFVRVLAEVNEGAVIIEHENMTPHLTYFSQGSSVMQIANHTNDSINLSSGHCVARGEPVEILGQYTCTEIVREPIHLKDLNIDPEISVKEAEQLHDLITSYRDCFALNMKELGCTDLIEMKIEEIPGSKPVHCHPYRTTASERNSIREIVQEWKDCGIVTPTRSPYASPVLLVQKKTGEKRLVADFRKLNRQTVKDKFPLPNIDDQLEQLSGCKIFTTLDLAHGYLQLPLSEEAKPKTAIITPDETLQFERLMFGLTNGPAEFQRLMNKALGPLRNTVAMCYLDDLLIAARDWPEMLTKLRLVFEALRVAKLTLRLSKCEFGRNKVDYLGFVLSGEGIKPGSRKMEAIKDFPRPTNVHEIRRFLGLTSFFRRFVQRFATRAEPLSRLTRTNEPFLWTESQETAFQDLKTAIINEPVLGLYNPNAKTELHTDASAEGLAGMLLQEGNDHQLHLIYCVSKKTTEVEKHFHSSRLELMAIVWAINKLRQYLLPITFSVVTDCQALVYLNANRTANPQVARWYDLIQEYDISEIRHRPGSKMCHVDALSRAPVSPSNDTMEEIIADKLEVLMTLSIEDQILMYQRGDQELNELIAILQKPKEDRRKDENIRIQGYELNKGRLFKIVEKKGNVHKLYVIPKSMRKSMVIKFHDLMGHFSVDRVCASLSQTYWFAGMHRYVRQHIHMCIECMLHKTPGGKQPGLLHPIPPGTRPFEIIHIDHLGPFIKSTNGNQELLVIVDNLTKFVRLFPSKNKSTKSVLKHLEDFILERGLPERIVSDRGTCFTSREFEQFCHNNGVKHTLNSTKHPQGNGQVERVNRTILPIISIAIQHPEHRDWDSNLKRIERDINNAVNKTTDKTPFQLLHGYVPHFYDGHLRDLVKTSDKKMSENPEELQVAVREKIIEKQEKYKSGYDRRHHRGAIYDVGEIVFMKKMPVSTGHPTKTQAKFRGPLVVSQVLPSDTYRVTQLAEKEGNTFFSTTAHTSQLKSWKCVNEDEEPNGTHVEDSDPEP